MKALQWFPGPAVARSVVLLAMGLSVATTTPAQSTADLVAQLGDPEAQRREAAAWSLGAAPEASAIPALAKALRDPDGFVRLTAAWALRETGTPEALEAFYPLLMSEDLGRFVLKTLEDRYDPAAQKALVAAVDRQPSVELRLRAFSLLDENFSEDLLPAFRAVAQGDDELLKVKALPALVRRRLVAEGDDLVPVFVSFLGHPDATVRVEAIRGLRGFDDERVIELFEEAIADADPRVHEAALRAFCALVDRATLRTLERLYEKAEGPDRATILSAPPAEKWKLMEPLYRRALSDPSPEPRVALMRLLRYRYYPDPEMLRPYFVAGAVDAEPEVRRQAGGGLAALPAGSLDVLARLVTDEEASVRAEVLEGLIGRERRDAKDLVRGAVGDAEPSVRLLAVEGLVRLMSTKEAEPLLLPLARDSSPEVRALAVRKLAWRARKGTATEAARAALQDPVPEVRAAGIDTLWNVKSKGWLETVAALLEDVSPVVRRAAVAVIRYETPSAKVLPHLLKALDDPDPGIRRDAAMSFSASTKPTAELVAKLKALRQGDPDFQVRAFAESSLRVMNVIPGGPSVLLPGSREGSLPQDVLPLYVFPGSLPDGLAGPPNLAMLGRYEAVEPSKVPEVLRELVFRQDEEGEIHYTSWLGEIAAVVTRRFEPDPEFPGVRSLSYWSAGDGVYRIVSWSRDKTAQTRGVSSFALSDDGQTLTFTQIGETTMKSNPTVESLRQTITDEKKLAKTLQMMGLKAGPTTTYYSHSYVYRRSDR